MLAAACLFGVAAPASGQDGGAESAAVKRNTLADEATLYNLMNRLRTDNGLAPLYRDPSLDVMSRQWSSQMAATGSLQHRPDMSSQYEQRVPGWSWGAENIAVGYNPNIIHDAFSRSAQHRKNILGPGNRVGVGVVQDGDGRIWVTMNFVRAAGVAPPAAPAGVDAWLASYDGTVRAVGSAPYYGDPSNLGLWKPVVGMAPTATGKGYWLVASDGGIFTYGDARFHGSTGGLNLAKPIVGMSPTPSGNGYWLVASDGGIFTYGDAKFYGSTGALRLAKPIIGMAPTPTGKGYWLVASDGGIFTYGDARFHGSAGNLALAAPIVAIIPTATGGGYWLIARDGGVFTYGDANFVGSAAGKVSTPVVGAQAAPDGRGYWVFTSDARVMGFGSVATPLTGAMDPSGSVAFVVPR